MSRTLLLATLALAFSAGCSAPPPPVAVAHAEESPAHAAAARPAQAFGTVIDSDISMTALADILATPHAFAGNLIKTEGTVARVCQRAGCWMELRSDEDGQVVRVPMSGHAFFLPRDCAGRHAVIEGRVRVAQLAPDVRAHLQGEGAQATGSDLSIEATGVELR